MRASRWRLGVFASRAFLAVAMVCLVALFALPTRCFAMTGSMSMGSSSAAMETAASSAEATEQLGLIPRLHRLTGSTLSLSDENGLPLESVGAVFPSILGVTTTPQSISTGIQCHMDEVCGYDPCTCGKPDAWGHCACGGFEDTRPTVTITSSDENVARIDYAFGQALVVPVSAGTATITVAADLIHYKGAAYSFDVRVNPFGLIDVVLVVAAILVVVGVCFGLFLVVRALIRLARKIRARQKARKARAQELKERYPLTWKSRMRTEGKGPSGTGKVRATRPRKTRPFLHDMVYALRSVVPVMLAGLALFLVLVPISTSVINDISVFNVAYTHEQLKFQLYAQQLGVYVNLASVVYGAVLAIVLFRFLHIKQATTAFLSVGLSRSKLYLSRFLVGVVGIAVGIGVPFVVSFTLNAMALGVYDGFVGATVFTALGYMVVADVAFAIASIAATRSGTLFETCLFTVAFLCGIEVVLWGVGVLSQLLLVGNAAGSSLYGKSVVVEPAFVDQLSFLNPLVFFSEEGATHQFFQALHPVYYPTGGNWVLVLCWFAVFVVLSLLGMVSLMRRRGEQAEMAGKEPVATLVSVAVVGFAAFAAAVKLLGSVSVPAAIAVGFALFVIVALVLLFGPLRGRTARRFTLAFVGGDLAAMAVVVVVVATGAFGWSSFVPASDDVESVELSYDGSPSYLTQSFAGSTNGAAYYYTSNRTYESDASIDIVRSIHRQLIASAATERKTDYVDFESTVVPYDVVVRYHMKDGSEVVRYFRQATIGELSAMTSLDNDERSRALVAAVVSGDRSSLSSEDATAITGSPSYNAYRTGALYVSDGALNKIVAANLADEDRTTLLRAMASDLSKLDAQECYSPSKTTKAVLMFTLSPALDVSSFGYSFSNAVSYVTEDWADTMAFLREKGFMDAVGEELDPRIFESLELQLDDPYSSINKVTSPVARYFMAYRTESSGQFWITQDFGSLKKIDTQAKIAEVIPKLRTGCYMTGGYLVQAKLRGIEAYVYFYLLQEDVPSYL